MKIVHLYFKFELFGGGNRGVLNYCAKLVAGEKMADIVAQNRRSDRWHEFSSQIHESDSQWMIRVDRKDIAMATGIDRFLDRLHLGLIMIASARKKL